MNSEVAPVIYTFPIYVLSYSIIDFVFHFLFMYSFVLILISNPHITFWFLFLYLYYANIYNLYLLSLLLSKLFR